MERGLKVRLAMLCAIGATLCLQVKGQSNEQQVTLTVRPSQTVEERVSSEVKEKELRRAAEDKLAAETSARLAEAGPKARLGRAKTIYISSHTSFLKPVQLESALAKRKELEAWQMAIIDGFENRTVADLNIEVDRPIFTYTFTFRITDRRSGMLLAAGKVTAFDGNAASPKLASRIVEEIRRARGESKH